MTNLINLCRSTLSRGTICLNFHINQTNFSPQITPRGILKADFLGIWEQLNNPIFNSHEFGANGSGNLQQGQEGFADHLEFGFEVRGKDSLAEVRIDVSEVPPSAFIDLIEVGTEFI